MESAGEQAEGVPMEAGSETAFDEGFSQVDDGRPGFDLDGDPIAGLVRAVEDLRRERDEDRALIEELQISLASVGRRPAVRVYTHWVSWVDEWLTVRISRSPQRVRWCHRYAEHPEVAERLEALWHAWEEQWPQEAARPAWLRDALDHQFAVITAEDGPLRSCSAYERQHFVEPSLADLGAELTDLAP